MSKGESPGDTEEPVALEDGVPSRVAAASSGRSHGARWRWLHLERELWWLALAGWRQAAPRRDDSSVFTHHRQSNWSLIAGVLSALIVIEGAVVHLWLHGAGYAVATWIALAVHVYLLVWVMGDAQALRLHTTRVVSQIEGGRAAATRIVALRVGLRGRADIPVQRIAAATTGTWDEAEPGGELVSVSGFANLSLTFDRPIDFVPMLGKPRRIASLRVQIDEPERFLRAIGR
jgi:hypothetical protein